MNDDDRTLLLDVHEAFELYPKQCEKVLRHFGYYREEHERWTVPDDMWLYYQGAGMDISYCSSSERWLSHSDLLMCALYYLISKQQYYENVINLNLLYNKSDPLRFLLEQVDVKESDTDG